MEPTSSQRMIIIILGAVLLAAVAVGAVIYFIPSINIKTVMDMVQPQEQSLEEIFPPQANSGAPLFNTAVLAEPKYTALDASLFTRGLLPVQPPATAGKPNPFQ